MNNKKIICFVRHGKTNQNLKNLIQGRKDFPLSEVGKEEALKTAIYLKENDANWDLICASPLSRAVDTAKIIAKEINYDKEILINEAFIEREFGVAEGMLVCKENYVRVLDDSWEGIEKTKDIGIRVMKGLNEIVSNSDYQKILIVSHAHAIKGILKYLDDSRTMSDVIRNCSMNYLEYQDGKYSILKTNISPDDKFDKLDKLDKLNK